MRSRSSKSGNATSAAHKEQQLPHLFTEGLPILSPSHLQLHDYSLLIPFVTSQKKTEAAVVTTAAMVFTHSCIDKVQSAGL